MLGIGSLLSFGIFIPALENEFGWSRATLAGAASMANLVNGVLAYTWLQLQGGIWTS